MKPCRVLTVAGSDSSGGAGIQADLKTITALGGMGMSVITALTAQSTQGVVGLYEVPPSFVEMQFDAVAGDIGIDALKTGMLMSAHIVKLIAKKIRDYRIDTVVVDPVLTAKCGVDLFKGEITKAMLDFLFPLALVVTPNIPEAEIMTGMRIETLYEMKEAAERIYKSGAQNVLLKGGHSPGDPVDVLYNGKEFHEFSAKRVSSREVHGTGCAFSAAIATYLAQGKSVYEAVRKAKLFIEEAIKTAYNIGGRYSIIDFAASADKMKME